MRYHLSRCIEEDLDLKNETGMAESQSRAITEAFSSFCYLQVRKQKQNRLRSNFLSPNRFLAHQ